MGQWQCCPGLIADSIANAVDAHINDGINCLCSELGMPLNTKHLITDGIGCNRTEIAAGHQHRTIRHGRDLILMDIKQIKAVAYIFKPGRRINHRCTAHTQTPAFRRFARSTAKGISDDLVTETNPDKRFSGGMNIPDQCAQAADPWMVIIGSGGAAGDQESIMVGNIFGENIIAHAEKGQLIIIKRGKQATIKRLVARNRGIHFRAELACLQNTEFNHCRCPDGGCRYRSAMKLI